VKHSARGCTIDLGKLDFVRINPSIQIAPIDMHAPSSTDDDQFSFMDQMLNRLLTSRYVICSLFDREQSGRVPHLSVPLLDFGNEFRRDLCRQLWFSQIGSPMELR
jgi:hypothetical protein